MELSRHEIENIICMKLNIEGLEKRIEDANKEIEKLKDKISNTRTGGNKDDNKFIQNCLKHNICYRCGKEMEFNGSEFCCPICGSIRLGTYYHKCDLYPDTKLDHDALQELENKKGGE